MTQPLVDADAKRPRKAAAAEAAKSAQGTGAARASKRMPFAERREAILDAARNVFIEKGMGGARTRDIAAEAGINEAMLYRHFASKDELFEAAVSAPLEEAVAQLVGASGNPPEEFDTSGLRMRDRTCEFMVDLVNVMEQISEMLGVALFRETSVASAYYRDRIAPNLATIEAVIRANFEHWEHADFDTNLTVNLAFGSTWFYVTTAKLEGRPLDAERYADQFVSVVFDGLFRGSSSPQD